MSQENNLSLQQQVDTLSAYIRSISSEDVSELQGQSKDEIEKALEQGNDQIEQIRKDILEKVRVKAEQAEVEAKAEFLRKQKLDWLQKREELLDKVFQQLTSEFQDFIHTEAYADRLLNLVTEAIEKIQSDSIVVRFDQHSDQLISSEQLEEIADEKGLKIIRGEILKDRHGVIAESADNRFSFDNTLEGRLEWKKPELRVLAARLLFEENNG
jgi:vacuolar-type H+-ATPase subunit E/Vma4